MIGRRIGSRYEIIRYIGGGGMSRVYLARDMILDRDVAIKILNYDFSNEEELKRRFMREALSATSLTHPNIVNIYDVGEDGDFYYLVMEYVDGQTLKEYIVEHGPLTPEQAIPIMEQLVSAISNAHYNGIIHRDIKPQNILMDHDGNVKITDFGIAMALSATVQTRTNSVLGTVHYLSPEQARGGMATKKSDIYALGIVLYELLTGKLPFSGESAVAIALKHLQEDTPSIKALFPTIPQSVENVILKATAKESIVRYQSAEEMLEDLSTVLLPERANEVRFTPTFDDEATMVIPIVNDKTSYDDIEATKKVDPVVPLETAKSQDVEEKQENEEIDEKAASATASSTKKAKKTPEKKKRKIALLIIASIVLLAIILLCIFVLPDALGWKKYEIPNIVDMEEAEAIQLLEEEGFKLKEVIERTSDDIDIGHVIKSSPEAGKKRPKRAEVTLYVSTGKELSEVSQYVGENYDRIASLLENEGFHHIRIEEEYSDEEQGQIIAQQPEAGTEVVLGDTDLRLTVSKGVERIAIQDVTGFTENQLHEYETASGFKISSVKSEYSDPVEEGEVISQTPSKGTELTKGSTIEVVLSKGKEPKPTKHIVQKAKITYAEQAPEEDEDEQEHEDDDENEDKKHKKDQKPQNIKIYVQDRSHSMADPYDEFEIVKDTEVTIKLEVDEGERGAYRIMRDDVQIEEKSFQYEDGE